MDMMSCTRYMALKAFKKLLKKVMRHGTEEEKAKLLQQIEELKKG